MKGNDWNNLGNDLSRIIEDAVHMGNFGRLNENINNTIREAFQGITGEEFRRNDGWDFDLSGNARTKGAARAAAQGHGEGREADGGGASRETSGASTSHGRGAGTYSGHGQQAASPVVLSNRAFFAGSSKRKGGAVGFLIGGCAAAALGLVFFILFVIGSAVGIELFGTGFLVLSLIFAAGGAGMIGRGVSGLKLSKKFEQHVRNLDGDAYVDIRKLSLYCHRSEKDVLKEIKKMLQKGWFPQGHLDESEKCLMISNDAYEQYLEAVKNARLREEENRRRKEEEAEKNGGLSEEVREILRKGSEYIKSIRESNDAIPGELISAKIYRMELLVRRIFQQTEAHPENAQDLDRLMEYYLPMTIKLLKAYEELDGQPVQGENIVNSKKEIEDTLDTLNTAYEKILDNLFQDTAWDVSSDISVLQTLLAQEGLMDDGFIK